MLNDKEAYDIAKIYEQIENELIDDTMKNLSRHRAEETKEGYDWEQWQVLQLQALEEYKSKAYTGLPVKFKGIDQKIEKIFNKGLKDLKNKQLNNKIAEMKNSPEGLNIRFE